MRAVARGDRRQRNGMREVRGRVRQGWSNEPCHSALNNWEPALSLAVCLLTLSWLV